MKSSPLTVNDEVSVKTPAPSGVNEKVNMQLAFGAKGRAGAGVGHPELRGRRVAAGDR